MAKTNIADEAMLAEMAGANGLLKIYVHKNTDMPDFDSLDEVGIHIFAHNASTRPNAPCPGAMTVFNISHGNVKVLNDIGFQFVIPHSREQIYLRKKNSNGSWAVWKYLSPIAPATTASADLNGGGKNAIPQRYTL